MTKIILITETDTPQSTSKSEKTLFEGKIISKVPHRNIEKITGIIYHKIIKTLSPHCPCYLHDNYSKIPTWIEDKNREPIIRVADKDYNTECQLTITWRLKYEQ